MTITTSQPIHSIEPTLSFREELPCCGHPWKHHGTDVAELPANADEHFQGILTTRIATLYKPAQVAVQ